MSGIKTNSLPKESAVIRAVDQWLTVRGIPHYRVNTGALKNENGRLVRFGATGMSDFYAIGRGGKSIWIECKRGAGGRVSDAQRDFLDCINRHGGIGIVVNSIESLETQLEESGIIEE